MNRKRVCLTCKNKRCVANCRYTKPEPDKAKRAAQKEG